MCGARAHAYIRRRRRRDLAAIGAAHPGVASAQALARTLLAEPEDALSIVNNLAEGAGRFSKPDKIRFYTTAIGSATESAAMFDVCLRRQLISAEAHERGRHLLERIVAMLIKLCRALRGS